MTWKWAPITTIPTTLINCSRLASIEVVPISSELARLSARGCRATTTRCETDYD